VRITALESRRYRFPLDPPFVAAWDPHPRHHLDETIVIAHTDAGTAGYAGGAPAPDLLALESLIAGADPEDTDRIFEICRTIDFHGGRNWTVEVAVWDLVARSREVPLWELLGADRRSFSAYASTGERIAAEARVERSLEWMEHGISALKIRFSAADWKDDLAVVEAVRSAVGDSMKIMVDANQGWRMPGDLTPRWDLKTASACAAALFDLDVYWLEEPLDTDSIEEYRRLREGSGIRIAAGEMVRSLADTQRMLEAGAVDVIQNDVVLAGGVIGASRTASGAAEWGAEWSPHTWTTGYGMLANLHVALAHSTSDFIEVPYDPPAWAPERRDYMLGTTIEIAPDGTISPPEGPGLGVVPDFEALERWRVG